MVDLKKNHFSDIDYLKHFFFLDILSFLPTSCPIPPEFVGKFDGSAAATHAAPLIFTEVKMLQSLKMQLFLDDKFPFSHSPGRR